MKKYTEKEGEEPFDWNKALNDPDPDLGTLSAMAGSWVTCAVGNQCSIIPRDCFGAPVDLSLKRLGLEFTHFIKNGNFQSAKICLNQIEQRSAELINQIRLKNNPGHSD